ncbi:MAG: HlyD family efflux transporter periplasmic adaptor subunit [bacterium]|nr:HlyD family efflux transporter periplasmic adaptor subunit [bacterium]
MMRSCKTILLAALNVTASCMIVACAGSQAASESAAGAGAPPEVRRGELTRRMLLTGSLVAEDAVVLAAPNANVWPLELRWLAEEGAEVHHGDKVVEFDNSQLVTQLEERRVQLAEMKNELISMKARVAGEESEAALEVEQRRAQIAKARLDAEIPADIVAPSKYERNQLDLRRAQLELVAAERKLRTTREGGRADIELQRLKIDKARSEVHRVETGIALLSMRAPCDGILIRGENYRERRPLQAGDTIFPGRVAARLPDLSTLIVKARLFDVDDGRVRAGQSLHATLDAFPEQIFTGRVREVDRVAQQGSRSSLRRFFSVMIDLETIDTERMRPGMSVKVVIEEPEREGVLLVPRSGLDWSEQQPRALLADGSLVALTLGDCNAAFCEVEEGLAEGMALGRVAEVPR